MASIRDVAKQAGVGVGTVSRALNGTGYVSPDTKKKIEKAAEKLGYTPNELARNLYRNRTGIVGVMVPDLDHPFFSCLAKHIEMELYRQGYKTMICNTIGISDREKDYLDMLDRNIVDGIITAAHSLDEEEYLKRKKPIVSVDREFGPGIPLIGSDHAMGGRMAAELLLKSATVSLKKSCRNRAWRYLTWLWTGMCLTGTPIIREWKSFWRNTLTLTVCSAGIWLPLPV